MANYATNIFYASTENQNDLNKIEAFLDDNISCYENEYVSFRIFSQGKWEIKI